MRRLAMISEHASPLGVLGGVDGGGQNVYVARLAQHLAQRGWHVDVFTRRDSGDQPESVEIAENVRIVHVPAGPARFVRKEDMLPYMGEFASWVETFALRQEQPYDLAHANFWMSGQVAADLKERLGLPFVVTFHALGRVRRIFQRDADEFPDARFAIEDRVVDEADVIFAECPQDEEDLVALYDADPSRVRIVPCGFDADEFWPMDKSEARAELGLDPFEPVVLQLGRMVPRKGVETVVRGFARLVQEHGVPARLLVVGGDTPEPDPVATPEIGRLMQVAEDEAIAPRVTFLGSKDRDRLRLYYNAADVFVTMPWYEPFGITPLEAMACARPVVGAEVGGIKYTVVDGETGYLVPPQDDVRLALRLAELYERPGMMEAMGAAGLRRARSEFTWERVADDVEKAYLSVLAADRPAPRRDASAAIDAAFRAGLDTMRQARTLLPPKILEAAEMLRACFADGGKLLVVGSGSSAIDARRFAAQVVGAEGIPHAALALEPDLASLHSPIDGADALARLIDAHAAPGDVLLAIGVSGNSRQLAGALSSAANHRLSRIALLGGDGGECAALADVAIVVPSADPPRIHEVNLLVLHLLVHLLDEPSVESERPTLAAVPADREETTSRASDLPR